MVVGEVVPQPATQVGLVEHHHVARHSRRRVPIRRSTYGFCQGDRGAVLTSRIPMAWARLENTTPYTASRSRSKYRGAVSQGNASTSCWAVHSAVGASVTLMWTTRRRSCARTTKTNKTLNITVGTTKKSTATRLPTWLSRKVRQVCDGGF